MTWDADDSAIYGALEGNVSTVFSGALEHDMLGKVATRAGEDAIFFMSSAATAEMARIAMSGTPFFQHSVEIELKNLDAVGLIKELDGRVLATATAPVAGKNRIRATLAVIRGGYIVVEGGRYEDPSVFVKSFDEAIVKHAAALLEKIAAQSKKRRDFKVLVRSSEGGLELTNIGSAASPLVRENYSPEVLRQFDHVLAQMGSKSPKGRVTVIEGEPGTGKTHFVRGLMDAMPENAMVVLLHPQVLADVSGPAMLSSFMDIRRENAGGPIVLVLEDADQCLAPRAFDNISSVHEILNLGDGILGTALDTRIVATTNVAKAEIDRAILRPGRLCARISIGRLSPFQSLSVWGRLMHDAPPPNEAEMVDRLALAVMGAVFGPQPDKSYSLGEIYGMVGGDDESVESAEPLGFSRVERDGKNVV